MSAEARERTGGVLAAIGLIAALVGVGVAGYLAVVNVQGDTGICVGVHGCAEVQNSRYGELFGVPISVPGLLLYLALATAALSWFVDPGGMRPVLTLLGFLGALAGALFSAYLTFVEAFVLDAWCAYCIVSALLMGGLLLVWGGILAMTAWEAEPLPAEA